jgi:MoxR-like ATPase
LERREEIGMTRTRAAICLAAHRGKKPDMVPLTDADEIASVRSNDMNDIHGFEADGQVYGYRYSVERYRKMVSARVTANGRENDGT